MVNPRKESSESNAKPNLLDKVAFPPLGDLSIAKKEKSKDKDSEKRKSEKEKVEKKAKELKKMELDEPMEQEPVEKEADSDKNWLDKELDAMGDDLKESLEQIVLNQRAILESLKQEHHDSRCDHTAAFKKLTEQIALMACDVNLMKFSINQLLKVKQSESKGPFARPCEVDEGRTPTKRAFQPREAMSSGKKELIPCVYCDQTDHQWHDQCFRVRRISQRLEILRQKGLCSCCLNSHPPAVGCASFKGTPRRCHHCPRVGEHHSSVCPSDKHRDLLDSLPIDGPIEDGMRA